MKRTGWSCLALFLTAGILPACSGSASSTIPSKKDCAQSVPAKVENKYLDALPALLVDENAGAATTKETWCLRRQELLKVLEIGEYGVIPAMLADSKPKLVLEEKAVKLSRQGVLLRQGECQYQVNGTEQKFSMLVYTPLDGEGPFPAILGISAFGDMFWDPALTREKRLFEPQQLAQGGYATIVVKVDDITPSNWQTQLFGTQEPASCGAIAMWAWAAQAARECVAELSEIDEKRIAITGCSRAGKAALWAFAQDEQFAGAAVNVTGCSGAAITRGKTGERVEDITTKFPDWMTPAYAQYANNEAEMPFDQHFLLALAAPRPLYVASAADDDWSDPEAEFYACVAASPAWGLYEQDKLADRILPEADVVLHEGKLWYHMRSGGHGIEPYDWKQYVLFFNRFLMS